MIDLARAAREGDQGAALELWRQSSRRDDIEGKRLALRALEWRSFLVRVQRPNRARLVVLRANIRGKREDATGCAQGERRLVKPFVAALRCDASLRYAFAEWCILDQAERLFSCCDRRAFDAAVECLRLMRHEPRSFPMPVRGWGMLRVGGQVGGSVPEHLDALGITAHQMIHFRRLLHLRRRPKATGNVRRIADGTCSTWMTREHQARKLLDLMLEFDAVATIGPA